MVDQNRLEELIEEATTHCYDEEEMFWGMFCTLRMQLAFPAQATVRGEAVALVGLDEPGSSPQKGVLACVRKGSGQEVSVPLVEVELVDPPPASAEWMAAYRYWLSKK